MSFEFTHKLPSLGGREEVLHVGDRVMQRGDIDQVWGTYELDGESGELDVGNDDRGLSVAGAEGTVVQIYKDDGGDLVSIVIVYDERVDELAGTVHGVTFGPNFELDSGDLLEHYFVTIGGDPPDQAKRIIKANYGQVPVWWPPKRPDPKDVETVNRHRQSLGMDPLDLTAGWTPKEIADMANNVRKRGTTHNPNLAALKRKLMG